MDTIAALMEFIERARSERKYADSTARGLNASVKLFAGYLNDAERGSFEVLLTNIDNIANDIYAKQAGDNITVTTLVVYKRRMRKLIADYHEFGVSPEKMAAWNPRRPVAGLRGKRPLAAPTPGSPPAGNGRPAVILKPASVQSSGVAGVVALAQSDETGEPAEQPIVMNRSEISLRQNLRIALELPADMTEDEAQKLKQLIDIMLPPR